MRQRINAEIAITNPAFNRRTSSSLQKISVLLKTKNIAERVANIFKTVFIKFDGNFLIFYNCDFFCTDPFFEMFY